MEESEDYRDIEIDEVKMKLRIVFNYYTSFGDWMNKSYLKGSKFYKMMQDA